MIHLTSGTEGVKFNLCVYCQNITFITVISFFLNYDTGILKLCIQVLVNRMLSEGGELLYFNTIFRINLKMFL